MMAKMMDWAKAHVAHVALVALVVGQVMGVVVVAVLAGDFVAVGQCVATRTMLDTASCASAFARVTGR